MSRWIGRYEHTEIVIDRCEQTDSSDVFRPLRIYRLKIVYGDVITHAQEGEVTMKIFNVIFFFFKC